MTILFRKQKNLRYFSPSKLFEVFLLLHGNTTEICHLTRPSGRDSGNDFSFPFPFLFLKTSSSIRKWFLFGYPKYNNCFFSFLRYPKISSFKKSRFFSGTKNIKVVSFRFRVKYPKYPKISQNICKYKMCN